MKFPKASRLCPWAKALFVRRKDFLSILANGCFFSGPCQRFLIDGSWFLGGSPKSGKWAVPLYRPFSYPGQILGYLKNRVLIQGLEEVMKLCKPSKSPIKPYKLWIHTKPSESPKSPIRTICRNTELHTIYTFARGPAVPNDSRTTSPASSTGCPGPWA